MAADRPGIDAKLRAYGEFWPYYLAEHSKRATRHLHFIGTGLASLFLVCLIATANWWWLLAAVVSGYFFAWIGHFLVEHNRPATFRYPLWSLVSDWRMFFLWLSGGLERELVRANVVND